MCGGIPKMPKIPTPPTPPTPPPPPPPPPTPIDPAVKQARSDETARLKAARGRQGTIVTGALGLGQPANTGTQKLSGF